MPGLPGSTAWLVEGHPEQVLLQPLNKSTVVRWEGRWRQRRNHRKRVRSWSERAMARGLHLSPRPNLPQWAWASTHWPCSPSITELWMKKGNLTLHGHYCVLTRLEVQVESDYRMSWMPEWYFEVNFLSSEAASEFGLGCDRWLWHHRKTIWTLCYGTTLSWAPDNSAWPEASSYCFSSTVPLSVLRLQSPAQLAKEGTGQRVVVNYQGLWGPYQLWEKETSCSKNFLIKKKIKFLDIFQKWL